MEEVLTYYRQHGYPHLSLTDSDIQQAFLALLRTSDTFDPGVLGQNMVGLTLANFYHPEMLGVRCRNFMTPLEVFNDDTLLREAILKRIRLGSHLKPWGIRKILASMRRTQRVSNFRPASAKFVYEFFKPKLTVDFSAGWGGRLLGALAAGVPYVGIDPSTVALANNQRMLDKLRELFPDRTFEAELVCECAEDVLGQGRWRPDLIFTSPPYFNVEKYSDEPTQSYLRYPTEAEWYAGFLGVTLAGCYRDMADGGYLVLNVNPDMAQETTRLALAAGFLPVAEWKLLLSQHQYNKSSQGTFRGEPVLLFGKGVERLPHREKPPVISSGLEELFGNFG